MRYREEQIKTKEHEAAKRRYWFTWNNFPDQYKTTLEQFYKENCDYLVFSEEVGNKGTKHVQGYLELKERKRTTWLTKKLKGIAFGYANGSAQENANYVAGMCNKKNMLFNPSFTKWGSPRNEQQGKRNELIAIKEAIEAGASKENILSNFMQAYRCLKWIDALIAINAKKFIKKVDGHLNFFQQSIVEKVEQQETSKILWVADHVGNTGKTYTGLWLRDNRNALYTETATNKDLAFIWELQDIVVIDVPKEDKEFMNYAFVEALKNGQVLSTKFVPTIKYAKSRVRVVVLANFLPDLSKINKKKVDIIEFGCRTRDA